MCKEEREVEGGKSSLLCYQMSDACTVRHLNTFVEKAEYTLFIVVCRNNFIWDRSYIQSSRLNKSIKCSGKLLGGLRPPQPPHSCGYGLELAATVADGSLYFSHLKDVLNINFP